MASGVLSKALRLLSGVDLRPLKDPTSLSLESLSLERLPTWMIRVLLGEARLKLVRHVVVSECSGVTEEQLALLCVGAPALQSIYVSGCRELSGEQLRAPHLTALTFMGCGITDAAASAIGRACPQLCELALVQCPNLREPAIESETLMVVSLQGCANLLDAAVGALCTRCARLESLDVSECGALERPRASGDLSSLRLEECSGLAAGALDCLAALPRLATLSLSYCRQAWLGEGGVPWPPTLRRLDAAGCVWLDDAAVGALCAACARLEELCLAGCAALRAPRLGTPALRRLDLRNCEALSTAALHDALHRSPELRALDVRGCDGVSEVDVPEGALPHLSLVAEPAVQALFFSAAARLEAEERQRDEASG